jgi:hypothetical protein
LDCAACAPGYAEDSSGVCVAVHGCAPGICPDNASCAIVSGQVQCICPPGYTGALCNDCDTGFHEEGDLCVRDAFCQADSCPLNAMCTIVSGEVMCLCKQGWGPEDECDTCEAYAAERTGFEFPTGWPTRENLCFQHVELQVSLMTFRSRVGLDGPEGQVYQCARSTFSLMSTQHVELQAYTARPATLTFERAAHFLAFDFGSRVEPISMEIRAHDEPSIDLSKGGRVVGHIQLAANQRDSLTLVLDPPARVISFWSVNNKLQHIAVDDVLYSYPQCR